MTCARCTSTGHIRKDCPKQVGLRLPSRQVEPVLSSELIKLGNGPLPTRRDTFADKVAGKSMTKKHKSRGILQGENANKEISDVQIPEAEHDKVERPANKMTENAGDALDMEEFPMLNPE